MAAQTLPVELVSMIAAELDDRSLSRLSQTCRHLHHALSNNAEAWRRKYGGSFDGGAGEPVEEQAVKYKALKFLLRPSHRTSPEKRVVRSGQVHGGPCPQFQAGKTANEARVLAAVKMMMKDASPSYDPLIRKYRSQNIDMLHQFCQQYEFYKRLGQSNRPLRETHDDLFLVQVLLVHELLAAPPNNVVYGIAEAQTVVYATDYRQPLLKGPRRDIVNLKYLRSAINLMYSALITEVWEASVIWPFDFLPPEQQPGPSVEKLKPGVGRISTKWLGTWCATQLAGDVAKIRDDPNYASRNHVESHIADTFEGMQFVWIENELHDYALKAEVDRHIASQSHPSIAYWQDLAHHIQELKNAGEEPIAADDRMQREATRIAAAKRNKSNLWGFMSDFLTTIDMDKDKNPDIVEDMAQVKTDTLMFKLASGREDMVSAAVAEDASLGLGYLQPLPNQRGIPGWMRITMIKFKWPVGRSATRNDVYPRFMSKHSNEYFWNIMASDVAMSNNNNNDNDDEDDDDDDEEVVIDDGGEARLQENTCWAYEGIVLPGGHFMVGRWWWIDPEDPDGMRHPDSTQQSGPFMYWACDEDQSVVPALQGYEDV